MLTVTPDNDYCVLVFMWLTLGQTQTNTETNGFTDLFIKP